MKEEFLHYLWKYGLFYADKLKDEEDNLIQVIHPGEYNRDSGPDFFNARLKINETEWAGNVEIHIRASNFNTHGHHRDHAYDNVILHIVKDKDKRIRNAKGQEVLTVVMEFDDSILEKYSSLVNNPYVIACQSDIGRIDRFFLRHWLHSLLVERLSDKSVMIGQMLSETGNDWEETFYRIICRYFGFRVNRQPFEMLASALPYKIIKKHNDNLFQVEALLFGISGMLDEGLFRNAIKDEYYLNLVKEYHILRSKYSLKPVHGWLWKFSKLRPANFPTIRISQLAVMLTNNDGLFSRVVESRIIKDLRSSFEVSATGYWDDHFIFGRHTKIMKKRIGEMATDILLINSVIPVLFCYGQYRNDHRISEKALTFLEEINPEQNVIINEWHHSGVEAASAFDTQALIQLRNEYCKRRRCLECRIGSKIISMGARLKTEDELILDSGRVYIKSHKGSKE